MATFREIADSYPIGTRYSRFRAVKVEHIGTGGNGNPRYALTNAYGDTYRTRQDTGDAYKLSPWEAWEGERFREYALRIDGRGSVYGIDQVTD